MTGSAADARAPGVVLIFPPLVELSFGAVYPSTAILAAWLENHNISAEQIDANALFADYLLSEEVLTRVGSGDLTGLDPSSLPSAFARWAKRERSRLVDHDNHMLFNATNLGHVVAEIARPFLIDPGPDVLDSLPPADELSHPLTAHLGFLRWARVTERVPADTYLIGLSVPMGPQLSPALLMARTLKESLPSVRIIAGGPVFSLMDLSDLTRLLRNHPAIDAVVRFDGEHPILSLALQAKHGKWAPTEVPGVSAQSPVSNEITHVPPSPGPNVNKLPVPSYRRAILNRLTDPVLSVTQARGCYWGKCDYCDFVELYDGSPPYRGRRPEVVFQEIRELEALHHVRKFTLITESIPPAFARRFSLMLIDSGLRIQWDSFAMVDRRFDRELLSLMAAAGCELLVIGMETMTTRVLKLVHKSADRTENMRFLRDAYDAGMRLSINIIPDLPSTTYTEALATLDDLASGADLIFSISIFPFEATRSSNVGRHPERFGLLPVRELGRAGQAQYALNHLGNRDPAMTDDERIEVYRRFARFAQQINRRHRTTVRAIDIHDCERIYRVPVEDLDIFGQDAERITLTNVVSKDRVHITRHAAGLLARVLRGEPFSQRELEQLTGPRAANTVLTGLASCGLLAPVAQGAPE